MRGRVGTTIDVFAVVELLYEHAVAGLGTVRHDPSSPISIRNAVRKGYMIREGERTTGAEMRQRATTRVQAQPGSYVSFPLLGHEVDHQNEDSDAGDDAPAPGSLSREITPE